MTIATIQLESAYRCASAIPAMGVLDERERWELDNFSRAKTSFKGCKAMEEQLQHEARGGTRYAA